MADAPLARDGEMSNPELDRQIRKIACWGEWLPIKMYPCWACLEKRITCFDYECAYITPENKGGTSSVWNMRPICEICDSSLGSQHLYTFIREQGLWINKKNPYLAIMVRRGEDPLPLYPLEARTSELIASIEALKKKYRPRNLDGISPIPLNGVGDTNLYTSPTNTIPMTPISIPQQLIIDSGKRKWVDSLKDAIIRQVATNKSNRFTLEEIKTHQLEQIVRECSEWNVCTQLRLKVEMKRIRDLGLVTALDKEAGIYEWLGDSAP